LDEADDVVEGDEEEEEEDDDERGGDDDGDNGSADAADNAPPQPQAQHASSMLWQRRYGRKMGQLAAWAGRFERDALYGHASGVRAARLLPSYGLAASASADGTVRLWDLRHGMPVHCGLAPSSSSARGGQLQHQQHPQQQQHAPRQQQRPCVSAHLGGPVRALALDARVLVAGGADACLHVWDAEPLAVAAARAGDDDDDDDERAPVRGGAASHPAAPALFDLPRGPARRLSGHTGPVSALALAPDAVFSGGWDYSVRVWRRGDGGGAGGDGGEKKREGEDEGERRGGGLRRSSVLADQGDDGAPPPWPCVAALRAEDWVTSLAARGGRLLVAAGRHVTVLDTATGARLRAFEGLHGAGSVACVEGSHDGAALFTGGLSDGLLLRHDLRLHRPTVAVWGGAPAGVTSLSLDDPWLLAGGADGSATMFDVGSGGGPGGLLGGVSGSSSRGAPRAPLATAAAPRHRQLCAAGARNGVQGAASVDLADGWACCAGALGGVVRTFDFAAAAERAKEAAAARPGGGRQGRRRGGGVGRGAAGAADRPPPPQQQQRQQQQQQQQRRSPALPVPSSPATAAPPPPSLPPLTPLARFSSSSAAAAAAAAGAGPPSSGGAAGRWHQLGHRAAPPSQPQQREGVSSFSASPSLGGGGVAHGRWARPPLPPP